MHVQIDNAFEDRGVFDPARDFRAPSEIGGFASRLRITKGANRVAAPAPNPL